MLRGPPDHPDQALRATSDDAVAIWLAAPGSTDTRSRAGHPKQRNDRGAARSRVRHPARDANGDFRTSTAPTSRWFDIDTAGCSSRSGGGGVQKRYYVNVYPALTVSGSLGAAHGADLSVTISDNPDPVAAGPCSPTP